MRLLSSGVFIDLKKAFDTVDHNTLLHKRECYGFRGVISRWFSSYLQSQTQTTQIGPRVSSRIDVTCGVPQSRLRSRSFTLPFQYMSMIYSNLLRHWLNFYVFADDTNILYANKSLGKSSELIVN